MTTGRELPSFSGHTSQIGGVLAWVDAALAGTQRIYLEISLAPYRAITTVVQALSDFARFRPSARRMLSARFSPLMTGQ